VVTWQHATDGYRKDQTFAGKITDLGIAYFTSLSANVMVNNLLMYIFIGYKRGCCD
jgi:hypothetical protein